MSVKRSVTRRSFIKAAAVSGAAVALSSVASPFQALAEGDIGVSNADVKRVRTACRGCGKMECGVWVTVQNGRATRVEGDESAHQSAGNCCSKSIASIQAAYHPDRMHYPMKRSNPKGEDPGWERISWDEANKAFAEKFHEITDKYGSNSIFTIGGTSRMYCMEYQVTVGNCLLNTPNIDAALQICKGPRLLAGSITNDYSMFWMENVMYPKVYVQWGTAPEYSNYDDSGRSIIDTATRATKHILIDPRVTPLGKEADYWLHVRPGTDGAIALAWTRIVIEKELYDDLFVKRWTNAPILVVEDMQPSGGFVRESMNGIILKSRLLKECDIIEGGSHLRFMAWDLLKEDAGLTGNNCLTYFDNTSHVWEGEVWTPQTNGITIPSHNPNLADSFLPDESPFNPERDPALYGEYEVTLKDGTVHKARPVWDLYMDIVQEYTLEKTEEITSVPANIIEEACLCWATRIDERYGNGGLHFQLAMDQTGNAIQTERAQLLLSAITGNTDIPAGNRGRNYVSGFSDSPGSTPMWDMSTLTPRGVTNSMKNAAICGSEYPLVGYFGQWGNSSSIADAMITGDPYPMVGCVSQSGNFMNQSNSLYKYEGLLSLDFHIDADLWFTPTAETADIVVPVAHWLEMDCPRRSQGSTGGIGATVACITSPGEAKRDYNLTVDWYKAFGTPYNKLGGEEWPNQEAILNYTIGRFRGGTTWAQWAKEFQEKGWQDIKAIEPKRWGTYRRWEIGQLRQAGNFGTMPVDGFPGFMTATGLTEVWSTVIETYATEKAHDVLPVYVEPYKSPVSSPEEYAKYPFILTTGSRNPTYFHSEHRQLPWCRELWPTPRIEIHPDDAAELGIKQGDWVWIENKNGRIRQVADLYYGIRRGVVNANHTWWYPEVEAPSHGYELSAVNCLVNKDDNDPYCGASSLRAYLVKIYKAEEGCPISKGGIRIITDASDERLQEWLPVYEGRD